MIEMHVRNVMIKYTYIIKSCRATFSWNDMVWFSFGVELYCKHQGSGPHSLIIILAVVRSISAIFSPRLDYFGSESCKFTRVAFDSHAWVQKF